jgi:beta-galactosidase
MAAGPRKHVLRIAAYYHEYQPTPVPNPALAASLVRWLVPHQDAMWTVLPASVTVHSATNADGERIHVVHNWSWTPTQLTMPRDMIDILAESDASIRDLELGPWDDALSPNEAT